jgi:hypothetical protein
MLTLKEHDGRLILSPSVAFRLLFSALFSLSLFALFSGVLFNGESTLFVRRNIVPLLLTAVTGLAFLYDERWMFDARAGTMEARFGLLVIFRRRTTPLSGIAEIRLVSFTKGKLSSAVHGEGWFERRFMPGMARLVAVDAEGGMNVIDTAKAARIEGLGRTGRKIAAYCGLPFIESAI